jgi:hypothetical protein
VVGVKDKKLKRQFLGAEKNYTNRKAELELHGSEPLAIMIKLVKQQTII